LTADRIPTGSLRLDEVLHGGLLKNAINLITGVPGSGKTILTQQTVFTNASKDKPALFLTTMSEPLDKVVRYGESLEFFDRTAILDGRVIFHDVGMQAMAEGLDPLLTTIDRVFKERQPAIVVIDGIRSLQTMAPSSSAYRQFLFALVRLLTATATTSIWNAPYGRSDVLDQPEAAVADAIIGLDVKQDAEREHRVVQILKLRGSSYRSGEHMYRISTAGIDVFPRMAEAQIEARYAMSESYTGTGIAAVDELLSGGGYWSGAATMVAGPTGIGKTLMGLHFLYRGGERSEPGILATFQENETQLDRIISSFGWSTADPNVTIMSRGIVDLNIDEWVYELMDMVEETGARRVVIDSLLDLATGAGDPVRFREWMFSLTQRFTRSGISLMLIVEVANLFQLDRISEHGVSHLSDNVILLQYVQRGAEVLRALTVLKTRAMKHEPTVRQYTITQEGFQLGDVIPMTR
jgi:circadian clock protein KaiC